MVVKMADSNLGAMRVIVEIFNRPDIDPDNALPGIGPILLLDQYGIYGTDIYVLFADICEHDLVKTLAVLRATQMGLFDYNILKDACHRQDRSGKQLIPVEELYLKVKERLPNFKSV